MCASSFRSAPAKRVSARQYRRRKRLAWSCVSVRDLGQLQEGRIYACGSKTCYPSTCPVRRIMTFGYNSDSSGENALLSTQGLAYAAAKSSRLASNCEAGSAGKYNAVSIRPPNIDVVCAVRESPHYFDSARSRRESRQEGIYSAPDMPRKQY